jgi:alginate O-acetyltransferase complex protein AlgI
VLFNSWSFLILLAVALPLYYLPVGGPRRKVWQVLLLLVASAVFYAWEEPRLLLLLFGSCIVNAMAVERILFWKNKIRCFGASVAASPHGESVREESKAQCEGSDPCALTETPKLPPLSSGHASQAAQITEPQKAATAFRNTETSGRTAATETPARNARHWLFWTVALNLGFLAFFKYAGFFASLLPETPITETLKHWFAGIPLPVGISFYTFQGISLVVDVWRNDISPHTAQRLAARGHERAGSIRDTSFYIAFFPQLVAGPIVKAHEFVDQIGAKRFADIDWITVRRGLITGYFLKIFVADNLAEQTAFLSAGGEGLASGSPIGMSCLLYGYGLQIFADFAGYSLIAIGLGALFGYRLPPNFNFPYLSTSITEFWRRWHLSLSSWLRDYLYFPLGGNRKGTGRTYFNLFLVMFLGGLWHGAAWKFAVWGSLHGLALAVERLCTRTRDSRSRIVDRRSKTKDYGVAIGEQTSTIHDPRSTIYHLLSNSFHWLVTFHLVTLLWLTFMMPDMASIVAFFKGLGGIFEGRTSFAGPPVFSLLFYGSTIVLYHAWGWLREHREHLANQLARSPLEPLVHGVMIFLVLTNPGAPRGFIYFQF